MFLYETEVILTVIAPIADHRILLIELIAFVSPNYVGRFNYYTRSSDYVKDLNV
jgi:hypothetical protein